ncbi:hypothetical protein [Hymenobacter properus]|uniref:Uncharacterized protein n=1 Tax=Hymenobacter properus TaxID=2791026 RepID=A0A931BDK4_9BACT|nr:hypothetical protein [Hymenobacter properus]MBF9141409.1 hypothetical protein [Hymenobacter properus]MBR7720218.1 hypothetical protein [Microvirga sp. SRT04]
MKPYRVEYVQLAGWQTDEVGLWVAENEDWLLLRSIPADYVVDGYALIVKKHIVSRRPHRGRKQVEQVLKLKGIQPGVPPGFVFLDLVDMMRWVERQYGLVEFADEEESTFFGWVKETDAVHLWVDTLGPDCTVSVRDDDNPPFMLSEIQLLRFDTDYFNSMKLLWQHKSRPKQLKPSIN